MTAPEYLPPPWAELARNMTPEQVRADALRQAQSAVRQGTHAKPSRVTPQDLQPGDFVRIDKVWRRVKQVIAKDSEAVVTTHPTLAETAQVGKPPVWRLGQPVQALLRKKA